MPVSHSFLIRRCVTVSPHHPISYLMVSNAIVRLTVERNTILKQHVPSVTGPKVVKSAMVRTRTVDFISF
jgi:hypothetical protein